MEVLQGVVKAGIDRVCELTRTPYTAEEGGWVFGVQVRLEDGRKAFFEDVSDEREIVEPLMDLIVYNDVSFEELDYIVEDYITGLYLPAFM